MRVVTNDSFIQRQQQLAQFLFMGSIGAWLFSIFFGSRLFGNSASAGFFQFVLLFGLLFMMITAIRMNNIWVRPPKPWQALEEGLKGVGSEYTIYHYMMPASHVLIGPEGIFAITTRFQDRPQKLNGDHWQTTGGFLTYLRQEQIGNPTKDAQKNALKTQTFLRELLRDETIQVQPLIVFVHPKAEVVVEGEPSVPVLYTETDKKKDSLKTYMKNIKKGGYPSITKEQQAELDNLLLYAD